MVCSWTRKCWFVDKSDRENKASWKLSMRDPSSLPGIHLPQIWLVIPNRSQPKAFQDHHFSACMRQNNSDWAKLPGKINFYLGLPKVSICLQSGQGDVLVDRNSHLQSVNHLTPEQTSKMFDACPLKLLISLLWPKRQSGETRLKEEIFTFGV